MNKKKNSQIWGAVKTLLHKGLKKDQKKTKIKNVPIDTLTKYLPNTYMGGSKQEYRSRLFDCKTIGISSIFFSLFAIEKA